MGEGQALQSRTEPEKAGLQGAGLAWTLATPRLCKGGAGGACPRPCAIPSGPQTWLPELRPSAAASVWKSDQSSDSLQPPPTPLLALATDPGIWSLFGFSFFLQLCENRLCPGRRSEGEGSPISRVRDLAGLFPK